MRTFLSGRGFFTRLMTAINMPVHTHSLIALAGTFLQRLVVHLCRPVCACLLIAMPLAALAGEPPPYPEDPFAWEREPVAPTEIGTARGQTHITALGALVSGKNSADTYLGGQLGIEFVLHEFGGIRISGFQDLVDTDQLGLAYRFSSVRVGPTLHVSPYRRVDLGVYAEGGLVVVDAVDGKTSEKAPEAVLGGFITLYLDSYVFVQMELQRAWANIEINNAYAAQPRTAAMLGIGLAF